MTLGFSEQTVRNLRLERDRHVAFAFAAADLLIEVGPDGTIIAASGAAHALLDADIDALAGRPLGDLVAPRDRSLVRRLMKQARVRFRIDPTAIQLARSDGTPVEILLGGCRLPERGDSVFVTATLMPDALVAPPCERDVGTGLLTQEAFGAAALRLSGEPAGGQRHLHLLRLDGLSGVARRLPADRADMLMQEIGAALRAVSIGGDAAGRLDADAFGVVTNADDRGHRDLAIASDVAEAMAESGVPHGQIEPRVVSIDLAFGNLTKSEAGRALSYALSSFAKSQGSELEIDKLRAGLAKAMSQVVARFATVRQMLADQRFTLVYQPVVDLRTRAIHHYEALSRFPDGAKTFETVAFSEDIGLISDVDLSVCRRVVGAILAADNASVAVNVSGRSVQNKAFRAALIDAVSRLGVLRHRLLFEVTESAVIDNVAEAERFLAKLRRAGHAICLDDFGAGATAYNYLRRFDVDFVKIDGPFLKAAKHSARERALIRSICVLCGDIGCEVIGEMIEDETAAAFAGSLGIAYGQGWVFGKPIEQLPAPPRPMRRKGYIEMWQ